MNTGKHNSNFKQDYFISTLSEERQAEIYKKDFFDLLNKYSHLSNWDEEIETEMVVSDKNGNNINIFFVPYFSYKCSVNYIIGVPETDKLKETIIEIWDMSYTRFTDSEPVLEQSDFNKTELEEIKSIIRNHCE